MTTHDTVRRKPLRLWPGALAALVIVLTRFGLPIVMPEAAMMAMIGGIVGALAIIVWWLFLSRAPWVERVGAIALVALGLLATSNFVHESIGNGMMGMMLFILGVQVATFALAVSAVATGRLSTRTRRASMVPRILLACGSFDCCGLVASRERATLTSTGGGRQVLRSGFWLGPVTCRWRHRPVSQRRRLNSHQRSLAMTDRRLRAMWPKPGLLRHHLR